MIAGDAGQAQAPSASSSSSSTSRGLVAGSRALRDRVPPWHHQYDEDCCALRIGNAVLCSCRGFEANATQSSASLMDFSIELTGFW